MEQVKPISPIRRYRNFWLLLSLIALILSAPFAELSNEAFLAHTAIAAFVIVLIINAVVDNRAHWIFAAALAAIWFAMSFFWLLKPIWQSAPFVDAVFALLLLFIVYDILIVLMRVELSDFNLLSATASVYLLIAIAWSISFDLIELFEPGSYTIPAAMAGEGRPSPSQFLYFSLTTLTTLGYGDMMPATPFAGIWATLEAAVGILYTAVLVARLVSLLRR